MPNRILTEDEQKKANALLASMRAQLKELSGEDPNLLFTYRRKTYKELTYDERGKPGHRRKLKDLKWKEQMGNCPLCPNPLPITGAELDVLMQLMDIPPITRSLFIMSVIANNKPSANLPNHSSRITSMFYHNNSKTYFVYMLASAPGGALYVGVTNDLIRRVQEHRDGTASAFTKKYKVHDLIYYEVTTDIEGAIMREKQLKKWKREWKIDLIVSMNPEWNDLYEDVFVN